MGRKVLVVLLCMSLWACREPMASFAIEGGEQTGVRVLVRYADAADVVGFRLVTCPDRCPPTSVEGGAGMSCGGSSHLLPLRARRHQEEMYWDAEYFVPLWPGRHEVRLTPARLLEAGHWLPSRDCAPVAGTVTVAATEVVEMRLVSQCVGDAPGALDAVAWIREPPLVR